MPEQASEIDDTQVSGPLFTQIEIETSELTTEGPQIVRGSANGDTIPGAGWISAIGLAEGGLLADVGIVLDLVSIYVPVVGTVLAVAVPTPFAILMLRRGPRATLLATAVATFLITVLSGPHFGWRMGLEAIVGLLLGWAMRSRIRPTLALAGGTLLVAVAVFVAALGLLVVTGLPVSDVVGEYRNAMTSLAGLSAVGATAFGLHSQWLAIRPTLAALALIGLHLWPLLLFLSLVAVALPEVACYYALANATAQVLGHDVRPFPSRSIVRLLRLSIVVVTLPFALPLRAITGLLGRAHSRPVVQELAGTEEED